jgi:hypothetical protein
MEFPAVKPLTTPVDASIDATDGWKLDHVPPETALVKVAEASLHIAEGPETEAGD